MARKSGRQPHKDDPHGTDDPPAGATLDRYEASMMLMIASRVLEAYDERERAQVMDLEQQTRKSRKA
jgi:hypothetical protein